MDRRQIYCAVEPRSCESAHTKVTNEASGAAHTNPELARIRSNGPAGGGACASLTAPGLHAPRDPDKLQPDAFGFGCVPDQVEVTPARVHRWHAGLVRPQPPRSGPYRLQDAQEEVGRPPDKPALHQIRAVGADDDFDDDLAAVALASGKCQLDRCNDVFRVADQFACRDAQTT